VPGSLDKKAGEDVIFYTTKYDHLFHFLSNESGAGKCCESASFLNDWLYSYFAAVPASAAKH
jgi:hypothetical protein